MRAAHNHLFDHRRAGVLCHLTSLPGPFDGGVMGEDARGFVDFLNRAGFSIWQMLPVGPVDRTLSPYTVPSTAAGNPRLIDPSTAQARLWGPSPAELDAAGEWSDRRRLLRELGSRFQRTASAPERSQFLSFVRRERSWLMAFALFEALKARHQQRPWWEWPEAVRHRDGRTIARMRHEERASIRQTLFEQYLFDTQWHALKLYANQRGVYLFGDMPVYVDRDSVEVWCHRDLFEVDADGYAPVVSGVPPDYFAEDGQLWGHPIYDWNRMRETGYRWWIDRIRHQLARFDLLRIDHFRALQAYWEVPGSATTAREGRWVPGPGRALLNRLKDASLVGSLVAEDLGMIDSAVRDLRDDFGLPGMLVLQFAFDGSADNPFLPDHHRPNAVVYTGTHDNDTSAGWYQSLPNETREFVQRTLDSWDGPISDRLIEVACQSPARLAILPMQDLLGLGSEHRMNTPGTRQGNWQWRFHWTDLPPTLVERSRTWLAESGRLPHPAPPPALPRRP